MINRPNQPDENEKKYTFQIDLRVAVPPGFIDNMKSAMLMVWKKHNGEASTFKVYIGGYIRNKKTNKANEIASYNPFTDEFSFDVDKLVEFSLGLKLENDIIIIAAHEMMHKVQSARGETLRPSTDKNFIIQEHYYNDPHEFEAWSEALKVLKKILPNAEGYLISNGTKYEIPSETDY